MKTDVIQRNFFRLLRSGAFGTASESIEPMSPWKWNRLYNISLMHSVAALINDGINNCAEDFFLQIPPALADKWRKTAEETENANRAAYAPMAELFGIFNKEQLRPIMLHGVGAATLYGKPLHRTCGDVDICFPYKPQADKAEAWAKENGKAVSRTEKGTLSYTWNGLTVEHYTTAQRLTNSFLNRKLQNIISSEISCCDSEYIRIEDAKIEVVPATLRLLLAVLRIARYIINDGISLKQVIDLGMLVRNAGDDVDYGKLKKWISVLGLGRMAEVEGALLTELFGFDKDEMLFVGRKLGLGIDKIVDDIFLLTANHNEEWYFTQGKNIFVRTSNMGAMTWQAKHLARFFNFYPAEALTSFVASFAHSLTHIEE